MGARRGECAGAGARTAWDQVRRWPALRGEAKLAWATLWSLAGGRGPAVVVITASEIGADQGTSDAAGRRALSALAASGLVHVRDRLGGRWELELRDPADVVRARRMLRPDAQASLPWAVEEIDGQPGPQYSAGTAEAVPLPVARDAPPAGGAAAEAQPEASPETIDSLREISISTLDSRLSRKLPESPRVKEGGDGSARGSVASLGSVLPAALLRMADPAERERDIQRVEGLIVARVADQRLRRGVVQRVAVAVADRKFPERELRGILDRLAEHRREKTLRREPWLFFFSACRRRFGELGLEWPAPKEGQT